MNAVEMQYDFDVKVRAHKKLSGIHISSSDIQMHLNAAQEDLMRKHSALYYKEQESRKYLEKLVRTVTKDNTFTFTDTTNLPNGLYISLPTDVKYNLMERITQTDGTTVYDSRVEEITTLYYNLNYSNPFKYPYKDMCWRLSYGLDNTSTPAMVHQLIIPSGFTFQLYRLSYICYPTIIDIPTNTTCQLDATVHPELVRIAVELAAQTYSTSHTMAEEKVGKEI